MKTPTAYKILPPGKLIDIGGYALHAQSMGEGKPTVVFENGLGAFSLQWFYIQPKIAEFAQTISYDRAGQGWSDFNPAQRTPQQMTLELHQLLTELRVEPPYILVAHSFGGLISRYYAQQYPRDVAGLVLVDTSHEMQLENVKGYARMQQMMNISLRAISAVAKIPALQQPLSALMLKPFREHLSPEVWEQAVYVAGLPKSYESLRAEMARFDDFFGQANLIPGDLGNLPLTVVTAGDSLLNQRPPGGISAAEANQMHQQNQRELAGLSTRGQHVVVPGATHLSIFSNPVHAQYVIDAVRQMQYQVKL